MLRVDNENVEKTGDEKREGKRVGTKKEGKRGTKRVIGDGKKV